MNKKILIGAIGVILAVLLYSVDGCGGTKTANTLDAHLGLLKQPSASINSVNIYFDASTSMKGYFASGDGQMSNVVSRFEKVGDKSNMFLIRKNDSLYSYSGYSTDLQKNLSLFDGGSTHFEKLIPLLCDKSSKGRLAVLVTDGIVFINKNASTALEQFQNLLAKSLKSKTKEKAIAIFKYTAKFTSTHVGKGGACYYDMYDTPKKLDSPERPFYIIAVGVPEDILALQNAADLKPELQLYYGIDKDSTLLKGEQYSSSKGIAVDPAKDIVLRMTLPKTVSYLYDADKEYFNHSAAKLTLGEKVLRDTIQYSTISQKTENGINIAITVKSPASTGIGMGTLTYLIDNNIPFPWLALSINDDSSPNVLLYRNKTFGLEYLLKGIKDAFDGNNPLIKTTFEYK